jgi:hypothetical protein
MTNRYENETHTCQSMTEGYLDQVFDVLDAHTHPCIMMGRFALRWMGTGVFLEQVRPHIVY